MTGNVKREWNGRYNAFHCVECYAFVRVTAIWINGFGDVQRVEGVCWRHGEVAVEGWCWEDLGIDEGPNSDAPVEACVSNPMEAA